MRSVDAVNRVLEEEAPALFRALSPLGRRAFMPADIPVQAAEARGCRYNGTIGLLTDGRGGAVPLPSIAASLALDGDDRDRALLYSPVAGLPELRELWRAWQRRGVNGDRPSSLPLVIDGLTHGLSIVADLFGGEGRAVVVPEPFWGNYRQTFAVRTGAELKPAASYREGRFDPDALAARLSEVAAGEPAVVVLNYPSNPGGYAPTAEERRRIVASLEAEATRRPLVVLCDDAYTGLVYEPGVPTESLFWELAGLHPRLVPIKLDGATKELSFFGGRVGFLTFGVEPESKTARAMESKVQGMVRSTVGSPVATSQVIVLRALRSGRAAEEVAALHRLAAERYAAVRPALQQVDRELLRPLPFNAGFFVLLELAPGVGVSPDAVRRHLIERLDTGVVALGDRYLRLAICSVSADDLPEIVRRIEAGVRQLAGR